MNAAQKKAALEFVKRHALPAAAYFIAAWYASTFLLHLSGGALWLPGEWRETVKILGVMLGMTVFGYTRARVAAAEHRRHAADTQHLSRYRKAILLAVTALVLLAGYVGLRSRCVIHWSPPTQWKERYAAEPLPPFIDLERGTVYLPMHRPDELREMIAAAEAAPDNHGQLDGLSYLLAYAPDEVFDWLRVDGRGALTATTLLFFAIHLAILVAVSAAIGLTFAPASALAKMVVPSS